MKKHHIKLIIFLLIFIQGHFFFTSKAFAAQSDFDLATIPDDILFDVSNMKPGDWGNRELVVQNKGIYDFNYTLKIKNINGSRKLYDELLLQVTKGTDLYFNGRLKDFADFSPQFLAKGTEEIINVRIEMPYELGNEFQGLTTSFEIELYAESVMDGGGGDPDDDRDPDDDDNPGDDQDPGDGGDPGDDQDPGDGGDPGDDQGPDNGSDPGDNQDADNDGDGEIIIPDENTTMPPDDRTTSPNDEKESPPVIPPNEHSASGDVIIPSNSTIPAQRTGLLLPNTATHTFNFLLTGMILLTAGIILLVIQQRRKKYKS
jgi:LPXTG-motif cell wall-anchored protein